MIDENKISNFTDLSAWQEGHKLVLLIYSITKKFPIEERFGLANQIRRASVSITSNIAEGFSRRSAKEKNQFFSIAKASMTETQNQLLIARDVGYISSYVFENIAKQTIVISKLLTGLIKATRQKRYLS